MEKWLAAAGMTMGNVVNLNRFRKQKAKEQREKQADVNRRLHGRTKAERAHDELQRKQLTRSVDGAKLDKPQGATPAADDPNDPR